jgi:hypothetical protein
MLEVTVHGGLAAIVYALHCFRQADVQIAQNFMQACIADTAIYQRIADWAHPDEVAASRGEGKIVGHIACRILWKPTANAINLSWFTRAFVCAPSLVEECGQLPAEDEHRTPLVNRGKAASYPLTHGVLVNAK